MLIKLFVLFIYAWMSVHSFLHDDPLPTHKTVPGGRLQMTSSAVNIDLLNDDPLTLTCTFIPSDHPTFGKLLSMKMSWRSFGATETKHLVTLTQSGLKDADDFFGIVSGQVRIDGAYESTLVVQYVHPTPAESGVYTCQAMGLDSSDLGVESQSSVVVRSNETLPDDISKCVDASPELHLTDLKKSLTECGVSPQIWFQVLRDLTARKYLNTSSRVFGVTDTFNSKSFYIVTDVFLFPKEAEQICKDNNGYMAEINTEEEFLFLNSSLSLLVQDRPQTFVTVVTGVKFNIQKDKYKCTTHSGHPAFVGYWAPNEPDKFLDPYYSYILLSDRDRVGSFLMADGTNIRSYNGASLCEVTNDIYDANTQ